MLVPLEDSPGCLLARGVVGADIQELVRGARLLEPQFADKSFVVRPAKERADDVGVDDAWE